MITAMNGLFSDNNPLSPAKNTPINCINLPASFPSVIRAVLMRWMGLHDPMIDWAPPLTDLSLP